MTNHAKEGIGFTLPIHLPLGIEDFVSTVFGVGLGKHHQLYIGWISIQRDKAVVQIIKLVIRQGET